MTKQASSSRARAVLSLWADLPGGLLYLLLAFPLALIAFTVLVTLFATGAGLIVLIVGVPLLIAALYAARGFGTAHLAMLRITRLSPIEAPSWPSRDTSRNFLHMAVAPFVEPRYWLYVLHGTIVAPITTGVTWTIAVAWASVSFGGVTYWFWGWLLPPHDSWIHWATRSLLGSNAPHVADAYTVQTMLWFVIGAIFFSALPIVVRGLVAIHHATLRIVLGTRPVSSP